MSQESSPWPPELRAFLARIGVVEGTTLGAWRLERATLSGRVIGLGFQQGKHAVVAHLSALDASVPCFSRTASFNVAYAKVDPRLERAVGQLMSALVRVIGERDEGGLRVPAPVSLRVRPADFRFADVDAEDLGAYPDAMHDMFTRRMDVMILRNVFSREQAAGIVAELERPGAPYTWKENVQSDHVDHAQPYTLGEVLIPSRRLPDGPELEAYFSEAADFRRVAGQLFAGGRPFEARIEEVLSRVAGNRPVTLPRGPAGQPYTPATIRALPTGGELALHVGNYFKDHGTYRHLRSIVDLDDQLSYFVTLAAPDAGGEIEVYTLEWADPERPLNALGEIDAAAVRDGWPSVKYTPGPGDMFLFDGGRYYHRVRPTEGPRTRWTIGGFVTISRDHERYYYWS
jgi:hypothetical protein